MALVTTNPVKRPDVIITLNAEEADVLLSLLVRLGGGSEQFIRLVNDLCSGLRLRCVSNREYLKGDTYVYLSKES